MTKEQEEAIEILENEKSNLYVLYTTGWQSCTKEQAKAKRKAIETVLNMLKEKDKEIEQLKENIDYQILCDFLINSVFGEEEPLWTEKHIEELLDNFEMRWKECI